MRQCNPIKIYANHGKSSLAGNLVNILSALENLAARNSRLIETYHILTNAYGIFWCYCFAKSSVSLPRDRFWDIQVSKIDSPTRQPLLPRPSCVRAASPHLRKLGAGYAALPQMTGRDFSYAYFVFPLRYRTPDKQCGPGRYRGLTAFASLSMAVSERIRSAAAARS